MTPQHLPGKGSSQKPPSSSPRNPRRDPNSDDPPPKGDPSPSANRTPPPPPPAYGFHMLDRRTLVLADGSVRSYFALPPDPLIDPSVSQFLPYGSGPIHDRAFPRPGPNRFSPDRFREPPPPYGHLEGRQHEYWRADDPSSSSALKRKFGEGEDLYPRHSRDLPEDYLRRDYFDDKRALKHVRLGEDGREESSLRHGRGDPDLPPAAVDVDPLALRKAFLRFVKMINESASQRKNYLGDGKHGRLSCLACGRASKEFSDMHGLIMHTYGSKNAELRVDHFGLHKALCVLMGWNYATTPDDSKSYKLFSSKDAAANREDLIIWPPSVVIHNVITGRRKDGRMEGIGNREMDNKLKELGFSGGKSKSLYGKEGHLGVTVVKFTNTQAGLKEAEQLARYFEKDNHGRQGWANAEAILASTNSDSDPALVKVDRRTGEKKRVLYGYLATASDLDKVDFDIRKKSVIKSRREFDPLD